MADISCLNLGKKAIQENKDTILDAFDKINVELPNGCRSGSCGVCVIEVLSGSEQLSPISSIEQNTLQRLYPEALQRQAQLRLACRAQLIAPSGIDKKVEIKIKSNLVDL